jgi:hypothetical protein
MSPNPPSSVDPDLVIDDIADGRGISRLGTAWRLVSDRVMGGVSDGQMTIRQVQGRRALCLRGQVSLANNGGFIQVKLELSPDNALDASRLSGVRLLVRGNGETYNIHLKTDATRLPWQSYRASFRAANAWQEVRIPFDSFAPYRLDTPLDTSRLRCLAIIAIGKAMSAEVCIADVTLYAADRP